MAGFYVHIPFCRQACRYCDFYFTVSLKYKDELVEALLKEIKNKKKQFQNYQFNTLYFGGGTPSVLSEIDINRIIEEIKTHYNFDSKAEITLEANPDDLSVEYLKNLKLLGINRLSIGIQSFHDRDLKLMRRSHSAEQAISSIKNAQNAGIQKLTIDLIYGIPGMSFSDWQENLEKLIELGVPHISAYHLTYEPGTVFDHWRKKKKIIPIEEDSSLEQFKYLIERTRKEGFQHYEISNFAREGHFSEHNKNYWKGIPYAGVGPAAHSYDGTARYWNISSVQKYISESKSDSFNYSEKEMLGVNDRYNEYIMVSLRTMWGINTDKIKQSFGEDYVRYTEDIASGFYKKELLTKKGNDIRITSRGIFLADQIIREFFRV
ncbi:MAG: radical SAM family heme chaperone HemW [Bacteroidales bacterium]|nr:radical SAM family heme chaperone HemW [Bacteroidales bacterium]MCF8389687.1 radical SAM family heme chaperone HemW [Bacteroidales bacterium]